MASKARELQSNPLRAKHTYKPRTDRPFTHSWAWSAVQSLATRHRFVSLTVEPGDRLVIRAYD